MSSQGKRVVLVDDSEIVLEHVKGALEDAGCAVTAVAEPSRAAFAGARTPDLVLLDVNMPQAFGDDLARFLKDAWGLDGRIYLYSSLAEGELSERARGAGADGYICKSWGVDRLVHEVLRVLELPVRAADCVERPRRGIAEALGRATEELDLADAPAAHTVRQRFAQRCAERGAEVAALLEAHANGAATDDKRSARVVTVHLHDLVGEAKLLGLDRVAAAAAALRELVEERGVDLLRGGSLALTGRCFADLTSVAARAALDGARESGIWEGIRALRAEPGIAAPHPAEPCTPHAPCSRRVLVVDHSPVVGKALALELEARGHAVALATDIEELTRHMERFAPDLVFLDVEMPDVGGAELCQRIRRDSRTRELPVILLSGLPEDELQDLAAASGASGALSKQRGLDDLVGYLDALLEEIVF
jgi:CheY-like chemotaxis protein